MCAHHARVRGCACGGGGTWIGSRTPPAYVSKAVSPQGLKLTPPIDKLLKTYVYGD